MSPAPSARGTLFRQVSPNLRRYITRPFRRAPRRGMHISFKVIALVLDTRRIEQVFLLPCPPWASRANAVCGLKRRLGEAGDRKAFVRAHASSAPCAVAADFQHIFKADRRPPGEARRARPSNRTTADATPGVTPSSPRHEPRRSLRAGKPAVP